MSRTLFVSIFLLLALGARGAEPDLQDPDVGGNFVEARFGGASDYVIAVEANLRNLPVAEESRGGTTGCFGPQWNWTNSGQPQVAVKTYNGVPGPVAGCPE